MGIPTGGSKMTGYDNLLSGHTDYEYVTALISRNLAQGTLAIGMDLDGTLVHATPGDHENVPEDIVLENLLNNLNAATLGNTFVLTGRPTEFERRIFPRRNFFIGTEHGSVISHYAGDAPKSRIGSADQIETLTSVFSKAIQSNPVLNGVQIEKHKSVTMTLGFTHIINPNNEKTISDEMNDKMDQMRHAIVDLSNQILASFPQAENADSQLIVKDTVTPTNAVVEIMPAGACKAKSLDFLRQSSILKSHFTVFGGDSGGDREVMEKVRAEQGICLGVGPKAPSCSHLVFKAPEHLRAYLSPFLDNEIARHRIQQPALAL